MIIISSTFLVLLFMLPVTVSRVVCLFFLQCCCPHDVLLLPYVACPAAG